MVSACLPPSPGGKLQHQPGGSGGHERHLTAKRSVQLGVGVRLPAHHDGAVRERDLHGGRVVIRSRRTDKACAALEEIAELPHALRAANLPRAVSTRA